MTTPSAMSPGTRPGDMAQARSATLAAGSPVQIATFSPTLPLSNPIAVTVDRVGSTTVTATDGLRTTTRSGAQALHALSDLGVGSSTRHTLVACDASTLATLIDLALSDPSCPAAPAVSWWDQRADFPGTSAVLLLLPTLALRWTLGLTPKAERHLETWLSHFGVTAPGPSGLLTLAQKALSGPTLPGLLDIAESDVYSWQKFNERIGSGWDWRSPDSRVDAALGLLGRGDAAEHFESLRLYDPTVATLETATGNIVTGTVVTSSPKNLLVRSTTNISRLRVGSRVEGWSGGPENAARPIFDRLHRRVRSAQVAATQLDASGALVLTLDDIAPAHQFRPGDQVTLRPRRTDRFQQQRGRSRRAARLLADGNWLAGRGRPMPRRTDVPFDVMLDAADS